jgi:hypothetical protein
VKNLFPEHFYGIAQHILTLFLEIKVKVRNFLRLIIFSKRDVSVAKQIFFNSISYIFLQVAAALQAQQQLQNNSSSNSTSINSTSNSGSQPPMSNSMMKSPTNNNLISTTSTTSANTHSSSQSLVSSLHSHFGGSSQLSSNEASAVSQI